MLTGLTTGGLFGSTDKIDGPVQCLAVSANIADVIFKVKHVNTGTATSPVWTLMQ